MPELPTLIAPPSPAPPPVLVDALRFIAEDTDRLVATLDRGGGACGAVLAVSVEASMLVIGEAARTALREAS